MSNPIRNPVPGGHSEVGEYPPLRAVELKPTEVEQAISSLQLVVRVLSQKMEPSVWSELAVDHARSVLARIEGKLFNEE